MLNRRARFGRYAADIDVAVVARRFVLRLAGRVARREDAFESTAPECMRVAARWDDVSDCPWRRDDAALLGIDELCPHSRRWFLLSLNNLDP